MAANDSIFYLQLYWWKTRKNTFKLNVNSAVKPWLRIDEIAKRITSDQYTSSERVDTSEWKKVIWKKLVCTQLPLTLASFYHAWDKDKIFYKISSYRSAVIYTQVIYFSTFIKWYNFISLQCFSGYNIIYRLKSTQFEYCRNCQTCIKNTRYIFFVFNLFSLLFISRPKTVCIA